MSFNQHSREHLGEDISSHFSHWDIMDFNFLVLDDLVYPMVADVNMLHPTVVFGIFDDSQCRLKCSSLDSVCIQRTSFPAATEAMYSASVDERVIVACFLLDQLTAPVPILITYPLVEH